MCDNSGMENIFNSIAPALLFVSSLLGLGTQPEQLNPAPEINIVESVELGLSETSPRGEQGGFAMPASGCSAIPPHPNTGCPPGALPIITVDKPLVRYGDDVVITWNPNGYTDCLLSTNLISLTGAPNPVTPPIGSVGGSRTDTLTGQETYTITCTGGSDSVTVKVLPRIQET